MKTLTFSNISVITEDVYLKLKSSCSLLKGKSVPVGEVILQFLAHLSRRLRGELIV